MPTAYPGSRQVNLWTRDLSSANMPVEQTGSPAAFIPVRSVEMLAVIGNVLAGLGVVGLFTATLRLTKPGRRA